MSTGLTIVLLGAGVGLVCFYVFAWALLGAAKLGDRLIQRAQRDARVEPKDRNRLP